MALLRTILTFVVALSLAALPARVGAIGSLGGSEMASSSMPACESSDDASCQAAGMHVAAADHMPMSGGCDHPGDHRTATTGACSTYCNNVPAIPAISFPIADVTVVESVTPAVAMTLNGIGVPPEPHPPKLA
jgi:hypothetical protein